MSSAQFIVGAVTVVAAGIGALIFAIFEQRRREEQHSRNGRASPPPRRRNSNVEIGNHPFNRNENSCELCHRPIVNEEYELSRLSCNHKFHCSCIAQHFASSKNDQNKSCCPVPNCQRMFSVGDI